MTEAAAVWDLKTEAAAVSDLKTEAAAVWDLTLLVYYAQGWYQDRSSTWSLHSAVP
jgi:hypothetical protein